MRFKIGHTDIMTRRELRGDTSIPRPVESDAVFASIANIQYGALIKYYDGVVCLFVYASEAEFKQHATQFGKVSREKEEDFCQILWSSQPIR